MTEQESFELAIKKDRYDQTTRLVFADWLEENGLDDEALIQRSWTREKQESEDWLRDYAEDIRNTNYYRGEGYYESYGRKEFSYEDLLAAARSHLETGEETAVLGLNGPDSRDTMEEFWQHYAIVTGTAVQEGYGNTFFACDC